MAGFEVTTYGRVSVTREAAVTNLENAIRLSYRFTEDGRLAFEHYRLHIGKGLFHPNDEPESLLAGAIERTKK